MEVEPHRVGGDEALGEADQLGAVPARLTYVLAGLLGRGLATKEDGRCLDSGGADGRELITHGNLHVLQTFATRANGISASARADRLGEVLSVPAFRDLYVLPTLDRLPDRGVSPHHVGDCTGWS